VRDFLDGAAVAWVTRAKAAESMGLPESTLRGWQARGLTHRGVRREVGLQPPRGQDWTFIVRAAL